MMKKVVKKSVLFIFPPIYEFALYDLFCRPFALMRLQKWFKENGWSTHFINALSYDDTLSNQILGSVKREKNGQGHFYKKQLRQGEAVVSLPSQLFSVPRHFCRYGIAYESIEKQLQDYKVSNGGSPQVVCISSSMVYWYKGVEEAVAICRRIFDSSKIVVGGVYATLLSEHCKNVCKPDAVITSSGAQPINELLSKLLDDFTPLQNEIPLTPDIDEKAWGKGDEGAGVIRLNEGCFLNCDYCASKLISPKFIPGNYMQWIEFVYALNDLYGISHFGFYDDALLGGQETVLYPFLEKIIADGRDFSFYAPNALHIRLINEKNINLMALAGFKEVRLGFESDQGKFHKKYDNKYRYSDFKKAVSIIHKAGFKPKDIRCYILAGLPNQKWQEVETAIKVVGENGAQPVVAEFTPIPKSQLWEKCVKESIYPIETEPLFTNNSLFPLQHSGFTPQDMGRMKNHARNFLHR